MTIKKDIIIVGGGASGMMCAIKAKENNKNKSVVILEKQSRIGRKLLSTGNGRCNLTNINSSKDNYHGTFAKYADVFLEKYSPKKIIEFFSDLGLLTKTESQGRVYPYSNHATSVLDVLRFRLDNLNVEIICDTEVTDIKKQGNFFIISTSKDNYFSEKVVISTGSSASPKLGADKSGLNILFRMGHRITELSPALCPIKVNSKILPSIKGIRATGKAGLYDNNKLIKEEIGEIQFTENFLSGICLFNLSSYLNKTSSPVIKLSLLPDLSQSEVLKMLKKQQNILSTMPIKDFFTGIFHKKLGIALLKECRLTPFSRKISNLTDIELKKLAQVVNNWKFTPLKLDSFNNAQVVSGGVYGNEINPNTMESLLIKNLHICGEAVDIDGDCGGYNLQFAFASGLIAGENL